MDRENYGPVHTHCGNFRFTENRESIHVRTWKSVLWVEWWRAYSGFLWKSRWSSVQQKRQYDFQARTQADKQFNCTHCVHIQNNFLRHTKADVYPLELIFITFQQWSWFILQIKVRELRTSKHLIHLIKINFLKWEGKYSPKFSRYITKPLKVSKINRISTKYYRRRQKPHF